MKILKRLMAMLTVACIAVSCLYIPASASAVNDAAEGVVYIESSFGAGTGFCVGKAGEDPEFVVTNAHVVSNDEGEFRNRDILVVFSGTANKFMIPEVYYIDPVVDICVLKLPEPTSERKPLAFCSSDEVGVGDTVYAIGYPDYGSAEQDYESMDESDLTITKGIVSKKTRITFNSQVGLDAILSDAQTSFGNSGGPLVNENGAVVGVNTFVTNENASTVANGSFAMETSHVLAALNTAGAPYEMYNANGAADETAVPTVTEEDTKPDNTTLIIIIAAAAVVVIAAVVTVVVVSGKKKAPVTPAPVPVTPVAPVTPAASEASIIGVSGILNGKKYKIGDRVVIGRNPDSCNICFPVNTKGISGVHCEIRKTGARYEIMDCGSSYGTYLGSGQKLTPNVPVKLDNGAYFYLGDPENRDQMFQFKS